MSGTATSETVSLTVHGPMGSVDLLVPVGASVRDVAQEYAAQLRLPQPPMLVTRAGRQLSPDASLAVQAVRSGDVLVTAFGLPAPARAAPAEEHPAPPDQVPDPGRGVWLVAAAALAVVAAPLAAVTESEGMRLGTMVVLATAALLGVLPFGHLAAARALSAPAFGGAAAFVMAFESGPAHLPMSLGIAALGAAVVAGVARALGAASPEGHDVWIVSGLLVFAVTGGGVLAGAAPQVMWAVLLTMAMLAARFVPALSVDVPDQLLIDLERLAVTAWSARDRTTGRRGRMVISPTGIEALLARGARLVTAACAAAFAVTLVSVPALLVTATADLDRAGARALIFLAGGGFLLAARSYRHVVARGLLRAAGLYCWAVLAGHLLLPASGSTRFDAALAALVLAACLVAAAIATGRGWRSVWWSRVAEIGETICGSFALGALVVAAGVFRRLWEMTS